jgi:uncharacterized protein (TIGR00645 family)
MDKNSSSGRVNTEGLLERIIFGGRWLLAPLYIGLTVSLVAILWQFVRRGIGLIETLSHGETHEVILKVLELLDLTLLANLILIVIFAGYENFVSKINVAESSEDRPHWMGRVDYSGLKVKLIGSLVAISVIELLKDFMQAETYDDFEPLAWRIGIHLTFVVSGELPLK